MLITLALLAGLLRRQLSAIGVWAWRALVVMWRAVLWAVRLVYRLLVGLLIAVLQVVVGTAKGALVGGALGVVLFPIGYFTPPGVLDPIYSRLCFCTAVGGPVVISLLCSLWEQGGGWFLYRGRGWGQAALGSLEVILTFSVLGFGTLALWPSLPDQMGMSAGWLVSLAESYTRPELTQAEKEWIESAFGP